MDELRGDFKGLRGERAFALWTDGFEEEDVNFGLVFVSGLGFGIGYGFDIYLNSMI